LTLCHKDVPSLKTLLVYESKEAWGNLWGPIDKPLSKTDYPENWKIWENEVFFPFLDQDPEKIKLTSYQEF
jgi:hypothetical protein